MLGRASAYRIPAPPNDTLELGAIAAPLWLAEALVGLASSFVEAEAEAHPDRPAEMSPATHDQCAALLYPVGPIIAELSAMAADQSRPFPFALPATFGPDGSLTLVSLPLPLPAPYLRGLLRGAERTQGTAQAALNSLTALTATSNPPAWLTAALQQVVGEAAAAASRLEMAQVNVVPFLRGGSSSDEAAMRLTGNVWSVVDTYLRLGQQVSNPLLLPGAPAPPPRRASDASGIQSPSYQAPRAPAPPPVYQPPQTPISRRPTSRPRRGGPCARPSTNRPRRAHQYRPRCTSRQPPSRRAPCPRSAGIGGRRLLPRRTRRLRRIRSSRHARSRRSSQQHCRPGKPGKQLPAPLASSRPPPRPPHQIGKMPAMRVQHRAQPALNPHQRQRRLPRHAASGERIAGCSVRRRRGIVCARWDGKTRPSAP